MSKNRLTKSQAISKFIERAKVTKRLSFSIDDLLDVFGDYDSFYEIGNREEPFDWNDIVPYIEELHDVEEADFEIYYEDDGVWNIMPEELSELKNLKRLNFAYQNIKYIPNKIRNLRNLETFNVAGNKLKEFPKLLYNLPKLKRIGLSKNDFSVFDVFYEIKENKERHKRIRLISIINNIYQQIEDFYSNKSNDFEIIHKKWGVTIKKQNCTLFFYYDEQIKSHLQKYNIAISVEAKKDNKFKKIDVLNEVQNLFTNIKAKTKRIGNLYYIPSKRFYGDELISFSDLIKQYKAGSTNIEDYSVYDAILNFGGRELFEKLEEEKKQEIARARNFFDKNKCLKNIEIENFKLFENINIDFSENINVIIGKNGYGKTSLLQAIALGLAPIQHHEYEAKDKTYSYRKYINKQVFIKYDSKLEQFSKLKLNWDDFNQSYKIYQDTLTFNETSNSLPSNYLVLAYGANLFSDEKKSIKKIVAEIVAGSANNFSIYSILEDYTEQFYNPLEILQELTDNSPRLYPEKAKEIQEKIKLIIKTLNIFLNIQEPDSYKIGINKTDNKIYIKGKYYFTNKKGKWELSELSEGYRKNILLITDIILRILAAKNSLLPNEAIKNIFAKVRGTILIDEYDKHLHATWQRELIFNLKQVFRNVQFIITTHNVFSLQSAVGATVHQILPKGNKIQVKSSIIEVENILSIIREFYTKDFFDSKTQNQLNLLSKYLDKIHDGEIDLVYTIDFYNTVEKLNSMGEEIQVIIASQLLQLNSALKKIGKKEFVL